MNVRSDLEDTDEEDEVRKTLQQLEEAHASDDGQGKEGGLDEDLNEEEEDPEEANNDGEEEEEERNGEDLQDSSEEEEEGQDEYDMDDKFLVGDEDEDDDEGEEEGTEEERKRRRRKKRKEAQLDEEDYELIGLRPPRPAEQRKRIRKLADTGHRTTAERLKEDLFGPEDEGLEDEDDDDLAAPAPRQEQRQDRDIDDGLDDEDEFADFLDYDDEGGAPGEGRRRRRERAHGLPPGVSSAALLEAQEIFGDVSDLLEEYGQRRRQGEGEDGADDDDIMLEGEFDDEEAEERQRELEERRQVRAMRKVTEAVEPELMARAMLRPEDDVIRATDLPERELLRPPIPLVNPDHRACAEWIHAHLVGVHKSDKRRETEILLQGKREVDGLPPDGRQKWSEAELEDGITDLSKGDRAVRERRSSRAYRAWLADEQAQEKLKQNITAVLADMFDRHMEVPYIAQYRKEVADELLAARSSDLPAKTDREESSRRQEKRQPDMQVGVVQAKHRKIRRWDVMWYVHSMALRWRALARRKEIRERAYQDALERVPDAKAEETMHALLETLLKADSAEEVADVEAKYKLRAAELADDVAALNLVEHASLTRRPKKTSVYETLKKAGLEPVVREIAISAEDLGENLESQYRKHEQEDPRMMPQDFAAERVVPGSAFDTPEALLHGARQMAVSEMVAEPEVRRFVRNSFFPAAVISTEPTPQGEAILDAFHPYGRVKRLRMKPVHEFEGEEDFLRIVQAEKENLITVTVEVPQEELEVKLMKPLAEFYVSPGTSILANAWNDQRRAILQEALQQRLLPAFALELRARMLADARHAALHSVADKLWDYASRAPLQVRTADDEELLERRRFMAVCWGPGDPATTLVMLDDAGQLSDILFAGQLSGPIRRSRDGLFFDHSKVKDAERIRDFILDHRPHVVMVGATNLHCRQLHGDLRSILDAILEHHPQFLTRSETGDVDIVYADETLAALWQASAAAQQDMADQPPLVRRAVALARCALDPLAVLASLCGPSGEILAANLHPLQQLLPKQDLLAIAERICITATNQVGVDINRVAHNAWQAAPLQFVTGLGPRKAQALLRVVQREQHVTTRLAMWQEFGVLGKTVFRNCAGSIRVAASGQDMGTTDMDPLDDTRVHPSLYQTSGALALVALGSAYPDPNADLTHAVDRALSRPQAVESINLLGLLEKFKGDDLLDKPLSALRDICFELVEPNGDLRPEAKRLDDEDAFWLLTGESPETLKPGRLVTATVMSAGRDDARVRLTDFGGLEGIVKRGDVSSNGEDVSPADRMQRGQTITARIKQVMATQWVVELTTASLDLINDTNWEEEYCAKKDEWYYMLTEAEKAAKMRAEAKARGARQIVSRPIRHPYFKNVNALQATELLADAEVGEYLLRPSSRGFTQITLTMKVRGRGMDGQGSDLYMHTEIKEGKKEEGVGAHLRLGRPLSIAVLGEKEPEEYEDLDEIIARFADPLAANLKQVMRHRKYRDGRWEKDLDERLKKEKQQTKGAVYLLGCKLDTPGVFYLGYIINTNPHREFFSVTPNGFYFRHKVHKKVDHVIGVFKEQPVPDRESAPAAPAAQPRAAQQPPLPPPPPPAAAFESAPYGAPQGGQWPAVVQHQPLPPPPQQAVYGQAQWPPVPHYPMQQHQQQPGYSAYSR